MLYKCLKNKIKYMINNIMSTTKITNQHDQAISLLLANRLLVPCFGETLLKCNLSSGNQVSQPDRISVAPNSVYVL